jgi:hypothetical protein
MTQAVAQRYLVLVMPGSLLRLLRLEIQLAMTAAIEFPTAGSNWGTVTHVGVFDASTSGNLLVYGTLATSKLVESGDVFRIPAGDLDISLD